MTSRLSTWPVQLALLLAPLCAILAARFATHSAIAAQHPRAAALLFLWVAADALALAAIAKAPRNRPGGRALLGAIAAGCLISLLAAASPVRDAMLDMPTVLAAMGLTVFAYLGWSFALAIKEFRTTASLEAAAAKVFPAKVVKFAAHESAMIRLALFSWGARPNVPDGATGFAYHRVINPLIASFLVLQVIEIVVVDLLVSHWSETAALVLLALGLWGALFLIALMKAFRLYPILLSENGMRVRSGTLVDMDVPFTAIASVSTTITHEETKRAEVLNAAILSHPNIVLHLCAPLEYRSKFGKSRMVERVAFRIDEPAPFFEALQSRI